METVTVKPWSKDQGDYVVINQSDFDKEKHVLIDVNAEKQEVKESKKK